MDRITRSAEIRRVFEGGRRMSRGPLTLIGLEQSGGLMRRRVGVIVGRKFGGAVQRNRIKRRMREILRTHPRVVPPGWDWLVLPRPSIRDWSHSTLQEGVETLFREWIRTAK